MFACTTEQKKENKEKDTLAIAYEILKVCVRECVDQQICRKNMAPEWKNWNKEEFEQRRNKKRKKRKKRNDMNTFEIDVLKHVVKDKYHGKWMPQEKKAMEDWWNERLPRFFPSS